MHFDEDHKRKKIFWGVLILLFGFVWYLKDTNVLVLEPFWPIMAMLLGVVIILKGLAFKPKRR